MHIGVLGGTGRTGSKVIKEAIRRGYEVTTLVRKPTKVDQKTRNTCHIIKGDATSVNDITKVLSSKIDILIHTISVPFFHSRPTTLFSRLSTAITEARNTQQGDHNCKQYIVMSSFGTHHGRKLTFPFNIGYELFLGDVADDKEKEEQILSESKVPRTVLKATLLTNSPNQNYGTIPFDSYTPSVRQTISRGAVASALLDISGNQKYFGKKIVVYGNE